jgi:RNase P subunit RPR2
VTTAKEFEFRLEVLAATIRELLGEYRDGTFKLTNMSRSHLASVVWTADELQELHRRRDLDIGPDYGRSFVCDECDGKFATEVVHCDRCGWHRRIELDACVWCVGDKPRST